MPVTYHSNATREPAIARFLLSGQTPILSEDCANWRQTPEVLFLVLAAPPQSRRGLSLLELILVLGVMIMIASLSIPIMQRSFFSQKLDKGADLVRAELGKARVRAMRTGELHAFFFMPGGTQFKVAPFFDGVAELSDDRSQSVQDEQRDGNFDFQRDLLPRGVRFAASQSQLDARAVQALEDGPTTNLKPILFYPDGTSQDALLTLQNEQADAVEIHVRGLTGTTSTRKVVED